MRNTQASTHSHLNKRDNHCKKKKYSKNKPWFYSSYVVYNDTVRVHKLHSFDVEKIQRMEIGFFTLIGLASWPYTITILQHWRDPYVQRTERKVVVTFWLRVQVRRRWTRLLQGRQSVSAKDMVAVVLLKNGLFIVIVYTKQGLTMDQWCWLLNPQQWGSSCLFFEWIFKTWLRFVYLKGALHQFYKSSSVCSSSKLDAVVGVGQAYKNNKIFKLLALHPHHCFLCLVMIEMKPIRFIFVSRTLEKATLSSI